MALLLSTTGCYHAVIRGGPRAVMAHETRTAWNLFWGIADANFDLADCTAGVAHVDVWQPWWGIFPQVLTLGIATPWRIDYVCALPNQGAPQQPQYQQPAPRAQPQQRRAPAPSDDYYDEPPPPPPRATVKPRPAPAAAPSETDEDNIDAAPTPTPTPGKKKSRAR